MSAIACVGSTFTGTCSRCDNREVTGTLTDGEFVTMDGKAICVTGCTGVGECGHTCTVSGQSSVLFINGKAVARVGDPVTGDIEGTITSGLDGTSID